MTKILFVCLGNICRSPMAEFILKDMVKSKGMESQFIIESAATSTEEIWNGIGNPVYPPAKDILIQHGIGQSKDSGLLDKRARQLKKGDYEDFDIIIGMDQSNIRNMIKICGGDPENKISRLMDYTNVPRDVADPWYTRDFEKTFQDISEGCSGLLNSLILNT